MEDPKGLSQDAPVHGGPGDVEAPRQELQPVPTPTETPKLVTVRQHGREYQLPEDVAQAWQEREQVLSRQGQELGELRRFRQQAETVLQPEPPKPNLNTLWFEDPVKAAELIKEDLRREYQRQREQDQQAAMEEKFWQMFGRRHEDLRGDEDFAKFQLQRNVRRLADMNLPSDEAVMDKLAEITRGELIRLSRKARSSDEPTPSRADLLEPATGERPARRAPKEDDGPKTMSDLIRQRQRKQAEARRGA